MKVRLLTALVFAVVGVPVLLFSEYIIFPIVAAALCVACVWEMLRVLGFDKKYSVSIPSYIFAALVPFFAYEYFYSWYKGLIADSYSISYMLIMVFAMFLYLFYLIFIGVFAKGEIKVSELGGVYMSFVYIVASFTAIVVLRGMDGGEYLFLLPFLFAWVSDAAAYFVGTLLGKHKLIPEISPKKTVEGAIGGVIFTVLGAILFGFIVELVVPTVSANYILLGVLGAVLSVVAQVGDLWASLIKREHGVKDYSSIFPGHGGVFDRFDSVLAVCIILMIVCSLYPPFTAVA